MKTRTLKKNKVNVITLGCSKNVFDSEVLMGQLRANRFEVEHESTDGETAITIINTCGFIDNAKQESIDTILACARAKADGRIDKLIVTGCLSERYKPDLQKEIPDVDAFFGTHDLPQLLKSLGADYMQELVGERFLTTPKHYAYLKISEGCDRPCSFCAIPLMRGKHISVPMEELVKQARNLVAGGTKELILIAQDSTYYGLDIYGRRNLSELLQRLADVDGLSWIRLHYAFPSGFPEDVLSVMAERPNICKYLDMPIQHISDRMLKSMRRGSTQEGIEELIGRIRETVPGIALRTTLIAGYPGETDEDAALMQQWVARMRFDRLGVFTYSHEEQTHAYSLRDDVPDEIKKRRAEELMDIQQQVSLELNNKRMGQNLKVLVDRKEGNFYVGRTEYDSPEVDNEVWIDARQSYCRIGDFVQAVITEADAFDLQGRVVSE